LIIRASFSELIPLEASPKTTPKLSRTKVGDFPNFATTFGVNFVNTPPAKAGGFGLRLKAGFYRPNGSITLPKSSSALSGYWLFNLFLPYNIIRFAADFRMPTPCKRYFVTYTKWYLQHQIVGLSAYNLSSVHFRPATLSLSPKGEGFADPLSGTLKSSCQA